MAARRLLRTARRRASAGLLLLLAASTLYAGLVLFGWGVFLNRTGTLSDDALDASNEVVVSLGTRLPVSRGPTSQRSHSSVTQDVSRLNASLTNSRGKEIMEDATPTRTEEQEFLRRMADVQRARHDLIRRRCADMYNITGHLDFRRDRTKILSRKRLYEHAYANDDFRFIICRVLKVGSFSWRKVVRSLWVKGSPAFKRKQKMGDYAIRDYDDETFLSDLENYTKVLFVREPFARVLSAYRDKYVELRHFPYFKPIGSKIIRDYRKGATARQISSGRPTFREFVQWLVKNPDDRGGDFHWRPIFDWYHPCEMHYDYIGKLETATEDAKYIFKMLGIDKLETYPSTEQHHNFSSTKDVLKQYYSQISPELLQKIVHRYREEFVLFNYTVPRTLSDIWS